MGFKAPKSLATNTNDLIESFRYCEVMVFYYLFIFKMHQNNISLEKREPSLSIGHIRILGIGLGLACNRGQCGKCFEMQMT